MISAVYMIWGEKRGHTIIMINPYMQHSFFYAFNIPSLLIINSSKVHSHLNIFCFFSGFQIKESFIYIGSSGIRTIFVFLLITYICYIKKRQKPSFDNAKSKDPSEGGVQERNHMIRYDKSVGEDIYYEIDDSLLCSIHIPTNDENDLDSFEDDENSNSIPESVNEGYLNPYQLIIAAEVDVHQYSTTKNKEDNSSTSDENSRDSGYFHTYQTLIASSTNTKHEYIGIEHLDIDIQKKEDMKTENDRHMCS